MGFSLDVGADRNVLRPVQPACVGWRIRCSMPRGKEDGDWGVGEASRMVIEVHKTRRESNW